MLFLKSVICGYFELNQVITRLDYVIAQVRKKISTFSYIRRQIYQTIMTNNSSKSYGHRGNEFAWESRG